MRGKNPRNGSKNPRDALMGEGVGRFASVYTETSRYDPTSLGRAVSGSTATTRLYPTSRSLMNPSCDDERHCRSREPSWGMRLNPAQATFQLVRGKNPLNRSKDPETHLCGRAGPNIVKPDEPTLRRRIPSCRSRKRSWGDDSNPSSGPV